MSRYIDADAWWKAVQKHYTDADCANDDRYELGINVGITKSRNVMMNAPSIDLVRCGECRHCESYAVDTGEDYMTGLWCGLNQKDCMIDDFCSYGSRSEKPNNSTISKMEQVGTTEDCSTVKERSNE